MKRYLSLSLLLFPITLVAADFTLIKDGKVSVRIEPVQPDSPTIRYAAQELQQALLKMADGEVTVTPFSAGQSGNTPRIVIGTHSSLPSEVQPKLKLTSGNEEETLIQEQDGTLWITGPTERAALYATYTFLNEAAGVRWLWPSDDGTRIPRHRELVIRKEIRQTPDMPYRSFALINKRAYDDPAHVWMARNRINVANFNPRTPEETRAQIPRLKELGYLLRMSGHSVALPKEVLEKHPEYMALYSGARKSFHHHGAHLCWSNPDVQKALCAEMIKRIDLYPEMDIAALYVADHSFYCQCEGCVAMGPNISTRWHELSKVLIKAMKEHRPDLKIWTLAYAMYRAAPKNPAPYDHTQYAISDASYRRPFSSGNADNTKALRAIAQWQERGMNMGLRQYEMIGLRNPNAFMPLVYFIADQFTYAKKHQLSSYNSEITPLGFPDNNPPEEQHWNVNRMNAYASACAMWNSSLTGEELAGDWADHAYHGAAPAMKKYYQAMETAWRESPQPINRYFNDASTQVTGFISPTLIGEAEAALKEARELACEIEDPQHREEALASIELDERMFGTWRRLYRNATPQGDTSIYRLLPYNKSAGDTAWNAAPTAELSDAAGRPIGIKARMLWDDGALRVRWQHSGTFAIHLHSIQKPGEEIEIALNEAGEATIHRLRWGTREPLNIPVEIQMTQNGEREVIVSIPEANEMLDRFKRLFVSLHAGAEAQWPAAPQAYGLLPRTERPTPRLGFIDVSPDAFNGVHPLLRLAGWESRRTQTDLGKVLPHADVTFINYAEGNKFEIKPEEMHRHLVPYFERGGVLMVYAINPFPVAEWINDPTLSFHRVGQKPQDILRRFTMTNRPGDWLTSPNELKFWKSGITPVSGFAPENPKRWVNFATIPMKDGQEVPWLMATRAGNGWIVVTSEPMGYDGGFSILGNRFNERTGPFIENLLQELNRMK